MSAWKCTLYSVQCLGTGTDILGKSTDQIKTFFVRGKKGFLSLTSIGSGLADSDTPGLITAVVVPYVQDTDTGSNVQL